MSKYDKYTDLISAIHSLTNIELMSIRTQFYGLEPISKLFCSRVCPRYSGKYTQEPGYARRMMLILIDHPDFNNECLELFHSLICVEKPLPFVQQWITSEMLPAPLKWETETAYFYPDKYVFYPRKTSSNI